MSPREEIEAKKDAVRREIETAFAGVAREGGISWGEAYAVLLAEDREKPALYRREYDDPFYPFHDRERGWLELVGDPDWKTSNGFTKLDPIAMRYYLPAAMMRSLDDRQDIEIAYPLMRRNFRDDPRWPEDEERERFLHKWSALSDVQRRSVKNFLFCMLEVEVYGAEAILRDLRLPRDEAPAGFYVDRLQPWLSAYEQYWENLTV
jgi:hypothetical protein